MLEQRQRVGDDLVDVYLRKFGAAGSREIQQIVNNLGSPERRASNLLEQRRSRRIALQLLGEHLRVRGNHSQRRVDLVGNACRQ